MPKDIYEVKPQVRERAHVRSMEEYERLYRRSLADPAGFWGEQARTLDWYHPWTTVLDADYEAIDFSWFGGGRLNACFNCVDRHLADRAEQTAILWAGDEPGAYRHISYRELKHEVCHWAAFHVSLRSSLFCKVLARSQLPMEISQLPMEISQLTKRHECSCERE